MDQIIDQIRAALAPGALPEARAAGATACRAILAALDASPHPAQECATSSAPAPSSSAQTAPDETPSDAPTRSAPSNAPTLPSAAVALLAQLGRIPAEHRIDLALDLAIAKLGAMLPVDAPPIDVRSPRFALVPLGANVPPSAACASCGERVGHGWWCKAPSGRPA